MTAVWVAVVALAGHTHFVVVGGLGGEKAYEERFVAQVRDMSTLVQAAAGDAARVRLLSGQGATREAIRAELEAVARAASAEDVVVVSLIGHGNMDGADYKFNVPGRDPTCHELRQWLDGVPARGQLVVLATSASGACVAPLAREGRVVLAATRSGTERNATVFGRYFVEALRDPAADRDHDETVTGLEAFRYTEQKVQRFYADEKRLATEHPTMSSEGAERFVLARRGTAATRAAIPALDDRKTALEDEVRALKGRKAELPREAYLDELERVLLELARVQEQIDRVGTRP
jgi:hypothetical protein